MHAAMSVPAVAPAAVAPPRTLVCVPATARAPREMAAELAAAAALGADVAELRLDRLAGFAPRRDLPVLLKEPRSLPALVTYRPKWEGGEYVGEDEQRFEALMLAMELGAEYVDIELKVADKFMKHLSGKKPESCKLIVSSHNYEYTPSAEELGNLVAQIQATGADIVKIATTATEIVDVARMFQILVHCQENQVPIIGLVMNDRGFISRVLCPKYGAYLTFGTLEKGKESAPAQPTAADLINLYNIRAIGPDTKVFGIIGKPVGHSKSPILHNEAFRSVGFNAVYVPFLVDDLAKFLSTYSSPDFAGFSCTIPHKEAAVRCCDEVDPVARDIGAVNTIIRRPNGKLVGYNTDYVGAISAIEDGIRASHPTDPATSPLAGRLFVVIGAGGAGKALAYGAKEKGARVVIANRTFARAEDLANLIGGPALTLEELENYHPEEGMILANTTAIGMHPNVNETPLSKQALKSYAVVFDAVYTPKETRLLREAAECGATVVSGLEMFIRQAMGQFELFTAMPDVIKVRLQMQLAGQRGNLAGMGTIFTQMVEQEGPRSLYLGLPPALMRSVVYGGLRLGLYEPCKHVCSYAFGSTNFAFKCASGIVAGALATALTNPMEVLKVRLQMSKNGTSTIGEVRKVLAQEGPKALWKGVGPAMARAGCLTASQVATYDEAKQALVKWTSLEGFQLHLISSCIAGIAGTLVTAPVDMIKTRLMLQQESEGVRVYKNGFHCAYKVVQKEGVKSLYKGGFANFARLGPQTTITFVVCEKLRELAGMTAI